MEKTLFCFTSNVKLSNSVENMWPPAKRLLQQLRPHRKRLLIVVFTGLLMAMATGQTAMLLKSLMDGLQKGSPEKVVQTGILLIALALIAAFARFFHFFSMNYVGELVSQELRASLQQKFMRLSLSFHNQYAAGSGGLLSRILSDISMIQTGLRLFADFFREPLTLVILICWLFWLNWKLTLSIIFILPVTLYFLRKLAKSVNKYSHHGQQGLEKITSVVKESLDGVRVIQSFNLEGEMSRRFGNAFAPYLEARRKIYIRMEMNGPITEFVATILSVAILLYMNLEAIAGRSTWGDIVSYLGTLFMINKPIKALQDSYVRFQETIVSSQRVFQILDDKAEVQEDSNGLEFPVHWNKIEFRNVSFRYHTELVLKNVSLEINRGDTVALIGESGSGKSTLANLLERFYDPTEGDILVDGISIQRISLKSLRKNMALVTQDVFLFNDSIEGNIRSGDYSKTVDGVIPAAKAANAHDFIIKTPDKYLTRMGERGNLFSGGEKQRISIARAIFKDAPILILDEATSALDSVSEVDVQKGIDQAMVGRTSIVIAHRLSTIKNADKICIFSQGQIIETGKHEELLGRKANYYQLCKLQGIDFQEIG